MANIFITGGSTGIGLALAKRYVLRGDRVAVCGRNKQKIAEDLGIKFYEVDVVDRDNLHAAIKDFHAGGGLDLLIANAGISTGAKSKIPDFNLARSVININVIGVLNSFEAALEIFIAQSWGHLVAIASVAGMVGLPQGASYCASKAAVLTMCESLSIDLKTYNIDVTAIAPGFIDTPLTRVNKHSMPFLMSATKSAGLIIRAIDKKKVRYFFPFRMKLIIISLAVMPRWLYRKIMTLVRY